MLRSRFVRCSRCGPLMRVGSYSRSPGSRGRRFAPASGSRSAYRRQRSAATLRSRASSTRFRPLHRDRSRSRSKSTTRRQVFRRACGSRGTSLRIRLRPATHSISSRGCGRRTARATRAGSTTSAGSWSRITARRATSAPARPPPAPRRVPRARGSACELESRSGSALCCAIRMPQPSLPRSRSASATASPKSTGRTSGVRARAISSPCPACTSR